MSQCRYDVCQLTHTFNELSLKLSSTCSIVVSTPRHYFSDELETENIPTFQEYCIFRGNGLGITFHVAFNGLSVDQGESRALVDALGYGIRDAEIWRQLELETALEIRPSDFSCCGSGLQTQLALKYGDSTVGKRGRGSKSGQIIAANVQAPAGVPAFDLLEIDIKLTFSCTEADDMTGCKRTRISMKQVADPDQVTYLLFDEEDERISRAFDTPSSMLPLLNHPTRGCESQTNSPSASEDMLDDYPFREHASTTRLHTPADSMPLTKDQDQTLLTASSRKRHVLFEKCCEHKLDHQAVLKLVDAALRTLICGRPLHLLSGVNMTATSPGPKLAEISPFLFSPGYRQAIAPRSTLLLTIANSLNTVYRNTSSTILKAKFEKLHDRTTAGKSNKRQERQPSDTPSARHENFRAALEARLWMICQRQLYDPLAARRLKPLNSSTTSYDEGLDQSDTLEEEHLPAFKAEPADWSDPDLLEDDGDGDKLEDVFSLHDRDERMGDFGLLDDDDEIDRAHAEHGENLFEDLSWSHGIFQGQSDEDEEEQMLEAGVW